MMIKNDLLQIHQNSKVLIHEEDFLYILPCNQLNSLISNFTLSFPNENILSDDYTIMPHGSVTLVLFEFKDMVHCFLFGPTTKPIKVGNLANKCDVIFIIEFQPAGLYPFTRIHQKELVDKILPFSYLDMKLNDLLKDIFIHSPTVDELLSRVEELLLSNVKFQYPEELKHAIDSIIQNIEDITLNDISKMASYSSRQLNRMFNQYLGMSIKTFSRLVRINKAIRFMNDGNQSLNTVVKELGYYDVSHFVKDFKAVCNITPQVYKDNMSDFYSEIAKY